ncbi:MAG: lytic murein transglycosylase [Alphaproteobacteria bacterium]
MANSILQRCRGAGVILGSLAVSGILAVSGGLAVSPGIAQVTINQILNRGEEKSPASFERFKRALWPAARKRGISKQVFNRALHGLQPDRDILKSATHQAEFVTPIWGYLATAVSERRQTNGKQKLVDLAATFAAIEARYGVSRTVIAAIWGMESAYGAIFVNRDKVKPVIRSLATLAHYGGRRRKFGRSQLLAALQILQNGDVALENMYGSWAGAMGHTQFIPTTYLAYAVDFDGDGRRDIWDSEADALASAANYLKKAGWKTGQTWGYEVVLPRGFNFSLTGRKKRRALSKWAKLGVHRANGAAFPRPGDVAQLVVPAGGRGPAFLMLKNFSVIKRYNNSTAYALAVGHLADRLAGFGPFAQPWPVEEQPLLKSELREIQSLLRAKGYKPGSVDGRLGPRSRAALRAFQRRRGLVPDGFATKNLLQALRNAS